VPSFRLYHLCLAVLAILAYLTGEAGIIHDWLGYSIAAVLVVRLLLSLSSNRQFGFTRFLPTATPAEHFLKSPAFGKILLAAILLCVVVATGTGMAMDKGHALGFDNASIIARAQADEREDEDGAEWTAQEEGEKDEGIFYEAHEASANLMLLFVALHAAWLVTFRRPLAFYMLFLKKKG